jgi:hypothetical protein
MTESPTAVTCPAIWSTGGVESAGNVVEGAVPVVAGTVDVGGGGLVVLGDDLAGKAAGAVVPVAAGVVVDEARAVLRSACDAFPATVAGEPQAASSTNGEAAPIRANLRYAVSPW